MTTDLVARPDPPPVALLDTDSWVDVVAEVGRLAAMIADTDFVPKSLRGSSPAVAAAILYGREVGLPPMTALTQVYVLDGRPALYAEAMRALILAAGHDLELRDSTGAICTAAGRRRGATRWHEVTWTIADARAADLLKPRSNWEKYPRAMLKARATAELARDLFPDVIHGFRAVEEITDDTDDDDEDTTPAPARRTVQRKPKALQAPETPPTPPGASSPAPPPAASPAAIPRPGDEGFSTWDPTDTAAGPLLTSRPAAAPSSTTGGREKASTEAPPVVEPPNVSAGSELHRPQTPPPPAEADPVDGDVEVVDDPPAEPAARPIDLTAVRLAFEKTLGITDRDPRLAYISTLIGRDIDTSKALTRREVRSLMETLGRCSTVDDLDAVAAATEAHRATDA